ncbi:hypothetical protein [Solibacillus sp. FSL K6-4121]|uniref:hypothetical protein n=1 Tax=Solibacillus sp. FSL K6-4121 TaxID=2921505 RepID=UPI0030F7693D
MKKHFNNENGVSLLEVVASMLLLTILLLSFFYLFVQNAKVTSNNNVNYTASTVARELSAEITKKCSIVKVDKALSICNYGTGLTQTGFIEKFPYQLTIQEMKDSSIIKTDYYRLRKVTIKVWDEDDDILTTHPKTITYTFQREVIK